MWDEGACLDTVFLVVCTVALNLPILDSKVFIHCLASLVAIESTPIALKNKRIFNKN